MNRRYQHGHGYLYPQRDIMIAAAYIKQRMFDVKGKVMDEIRYKTGIGRNSRPLRRHNNEWQRSALNRQDNMPSFSAFHPEHAGYHMSWSEDSLYNRFNEYHSMDPHYQQNYHRQSGREAYQSFDVCCDQQENACHDEIESEREQSEEDSFSQPSVSNHSSEQAVPCNSKLKDDISKGVNTKTKSSSKTSKTADQKSHGSQSNQNHGVPRKRQYAEAMGTDLSVQVQTIGTRKVQKIHSSSAKETSCAAAVGTDSSMQATKNIGSTAKEISSSQNVKTDAVIDLLGDEEFETLKCDLCDFMVPTKTGSKSLLELMTQHFKQFQHNSSSLVKVAKDKNDKNKLICVVSDSYYTMPASTHICKTNTTIPMCPKQGCHSIFETVWLCAKHYHVFHDQSVDNCYGLGKVVQRKLATCLATNYCERCGVGFSTPNKLHKHWKKTNHYPVALPKYPEMCVYFCRYCTDMYKSFSTCRLHMVKNHKQGAERMAMDVIYVQCPTSLLFLPPVQSKSLTSNIAREIASLHGIRDAKYWGNGKLLKRFKKRIDEKIREMKKLKKTATEDTVVS